MTKPELADRLAQTIRDLDELEKERATVLESFRQRKTILQSDLRAFCEDVDQMTLEEAV